MLNSTDIPAKCSSWYQRRFLRGECLPLSQRFSGCVPGRSPKAPRGPSRAFQWTRSLWWLLWFLWCRFQPLPGHCYWFGNPIWKKTFMLNNTLESYPLKACNRQTDVQNHVLGGEVVKPNTTCLLPRWEACGRGRVRTLFRWSRSLRHRDTEKEEWESKGA